MSFNPIPGFEEGPEPDLPVDVALALKVVPPELCITYGGNPEQYISAAFRKLMLENEQLRAQLNRPKIYVIRANQTMNPSRSLGPSTEPSSSPSAE